jgi:hypothetical protein
MPTESQLEQAERREVLENDKRLREQGSAYIHHQHDEAGGRFKEVGASNVIGTTEIPNYPAASPSWQIQLPDEPPLGHDNPTLEVGSELPQGQGAPETPSTDVECGAPPSSPRTYRRS